MSRSLADYGWSFDLQVFAPQMAGAAELAAACPKVTFVLQHAGMLEDLSPQGWAEWRAGMKRLAAQPNVVIKDLGARHLHPSQRSGAYRGGHARDRRDLRRGALPVRLEFSDREALDHVCTSWSTRTATPRRNCPLPTSASAARHRDARLSPRLTANSKGEAMALEIKILDYGDIELESSFLVLGRDCGRTRRVPTFGFLILGGTWPVVVDTGYRSNQIMETLGMRGLQFHENMIENQLARHGVRMGDVRYVLHTHLHIDHAGKDDLFPMNTTVGVNRRELEYSVSGLMHPQYPAARHQAPDRPAAHQGRAALLRSGNLRPGRADAGRLPGSRRRAHRRLDERARRHRRRRRDDLRRRDLRFQRPDRRAVPRDQRHGAARDRQSRRLQARREGADQEAALERALPAAGARPPAKIEHGFVIGRMHDQVPGPVVQSLPKRNWFPA